MTVNFLIDDRTLGPGHPCYVIAEMSGNHLQSFENAIALVHAAKDAGADAVKLQTYTADTITLNCDNEYFQVKSGTVWDGTTLHKLYSQFFTPWDWQPRIKAEAERLGMACFSSPFDFTAVDFLEDMGVPAYKIASFELIDLPLIRKVAATGKPLIMSTGMASLGEIDEAVKTARGAGASQIALLKCSSAYPSPPEAINLSAIPHLAQTFGTLAGLSDHTTGIAVPVAAVAMGASIVEKHLTLSRADGGPEASFALEPDEFKQMVTQLRIAEQAIGQVKYNAQAEQPSRVYRRSLFIVKPIAAGEKLTPQNIKSIRPGHGLHPRHYVDVLGSIANRDLPAGTPLSWQCIEPSGSLQPALI